LAGPLGAEFIKSFQGWRPQIQATSTCNKYSLREHGSAVKSKGVQIGMTFTESSLVGEYEVSSSRFHRDGATRGGAARVVVIATAVLSVLVSAFAVHVVALKGDGEVELLVCGGSVLEDCEPCSTVGVTNTKVERSKVTPRVGRGSPLAAVLGRDTGRVDVVLGRGTLSSPLVVGGIRASQIGNATRVGSDGNGLTLGTGVVSTADSSTGGHFVANKDSDLGRTSDAKSVVLSVGLVKLAVLAKKTTNGLTSQTLGRGPVSLLVAGRAGV
jgi:hypothetical protein